MTPPIDTTGPTGTGLGVPIASDPVGTRLLVSVRNASEAAAALAGGASVIDIKEPARGPLGASSPATIAEIVDAVAGRAPVTAALGEFADGPAVPTKPGLGVVKVGLAGSAGADWEHRLAEFHQERCKGTELAVAAYADWRKAASPSPDAVLSALCRLSLRWMVLDTWSKAGECSLDLLGSPRVRTLLTAAREAGVGVVLAGGLTLERVEEAARLGPALVGVRGAACDGGRNGVVDPNLVRAVAERVAACRVAVSERR